jgi:hypothetical protein
MPLDAPMITTTCGRRLDLRPIGSFRSFMVANRLGLAKPRRWKKSA